MSVHSAYLQELHRNTSTVFTAQKGWKSVAFTGCHGKNRSRFCGQCKKRLWLFDSASKLRWQCMQQCRLCSRGNVHLSVLRQPHPTGSQLWLTTLCPLFCWCNTTPSIWLSYSGPIETDLRVCPQQLTPLMKRSCMNPSWLLLWRRFPLRIPHWFLLICPYKMDSLQNGLQRQHQFSPFFTSRT